MEAGTGLAAMSMFQGVIGAYSSYMAGKAAKAVGKSNAYVANLAAEDAMRRGQVAEAQMRQKTKKLIGSQKASLAAQGIRTDTGSAADVQNEAADIGEMDALTIKNNALREAFGYRISGLQASAQGRITQMADNSQAMQSLLTGGMRAASYYNYGGGQ